jgi:hypothetical protein
MVSILIVYIISQMIQLLFISLFFYWLSRRLQGIENVLVDIRNVLEDSNFPRYVNGEKRVKI